MAVTCLPGEILSCLEGREKQLSKGSSLRAGQACQPGPPWGRAPPQAPLLPQARQGPCGLGSACQRHAHCRNGKALIVLNCFPECLYEQQRKEILQPGRRPEACSVLQRGPQSSQGKHAPSAVAIFACVSN